MTTMLDKCAVAGDITQAIDRRGAWTVALTVIGGTANTAVKIQSAPSASGVFTDFKTLISADDADADQYKGFVVDLHGADKFIKVTGAVMATAVLGDCDHDIKDVTIKVGEVPSEAELENNKAATIDVSAYTEPVEVSPSEGYDGMKKTTVTLSNIPEAKEEQTKSVTITTNGDSTVEPDEGKVLSSVSVTVNVTPSYPEFYAYYNDGLNQTIYLPYYTLPEDFTTYDPNSIRTAHINNNTLGFGNLNSEFSETPSIDASTSTSFTIWIDGSSYIFNRL